MNDYNFGWKNICCTHCLSNGIVILKVAPVGLNSFSTTSILPFKDFRMVFTIYKPTPAPPCSAVLVLNSPKIHCLSSSSIPYPLSEK